MMSDVPLTDEQTKETKKLIRSADQNNSFLCSGALAIAKSLDIPFQEIGRITNELDIKISKCQVGCF